MEGAGIRLKGLTKRYGDHILYEGFDLYLPKHEIISILGPSGCGKTTLLNFIAGLTEAEGGSIEGIHAEKLGYMFQEPRLIPWLTVEQNLSFALSHVLDQQTYVEKRDRILTRLDMQSKLKRYPHQLSGGEQQRIALARAFLMPSDVLLMDEAFKGLDLVTKNALLKAFIDLWTKDPKTVVAVSHDISEAVMLSDCILLFSKSPVKVLTKICLTEERRRSTDPDMHQRLSEELKAEMLKAL